MEFTEKVTAQQYAEIHEVNIFEVGPSGEVKLSALLRLCQNVSSAHLEKIGLGYKKLREEGKVFLVISNKAEIARMPGLEEKIRILTYPCGNAGVTFYRNFEIFAKGKNGQEECIVKVHQSSVMADPLSHKLLRPKELYAYGIFEEKKTELQDRVSRIDAKDFLAEGEELADLGERTVRYSDLDFNGHMNNTVYGDVAEDFLPGGREGRTYTFIQVDYVSEAFLGETIRLHGMEKDGAILLQGFHERGLSFSVLAKMKKIARNG